MDKLENLLKNKQTVAVVCNQWGDTGKGKFSDYFAKMWADVIARGTGGNNAGHTVVLNGKERVFHLIPAGIIYDEQGKINILGNGMAIDIKVLTEEMDALDADKVSYNNLMISRDAHVVMPYHIDVDKRRNQSQAKKGIGSTGKGMGPVYTDKIARRGIMIKDLFNKNILEEKIKKINDNNIYPNDIIIDIDKIIHELKPFIERIKPYVRDTVKQMHKFMGEGKKILLEGAQGLLLSIEHGTYPYVTSSDCSLNGTASGVGLSANVVDLPLGIIKFPVMTRVGGGPFPTEIGGNLYAENCLEQEYNVHSELQAFKIPHSVHYNNTVIYDHADPKIIELMNYPLPFMKSVGLRLAMGEYGATTGRPRRIGWTDALAAKYARNINGPLFILTKVDSVAGLDEFKIGTGYFENNSGQHFEFDKNPEFLSNVNPMYQSYEGYGDISDKRGYNALPNALRKSITDFEKFTGGDVKIVSIGPEASQTIIK